MNIIIVGNGKVGYTLAAHLSQENNDVVIIDRDLEALRKASEMLDVICIKGNGLSANILLQAGAKTADLIIAATSRDEVNMLCCLTAKKLGVKHSIARIRDPEYSYELTMLKEKMGLGMVINPELEAAAEMVRLLRFPSAMNIETFVGGRVEIVSFRVLPVNTELTEMPICEVMKRVRYNILFSSIVRGDEVLIPNGDMTILPDDILYVVGQPSEVSKFLKSIGKVTEKIKEVMVIGGGRIAYYLCSVLCKMGKRVRIIEIDEKTCVELSESLPECLIIHGDGTDDDVLRGENISGMGAVITITDRDEENLIMALYASHLGVPKVIAKINRLNYIDIIKSLGIESIVSPKNIAAYQIIRFVRAMNNAASRNIERLYKIADGRAEALEFSVNEETKFLGVPFKDVSFKKNFLVAAIVRKKQIIIPKGNDHMEQGDYIIIVTKDESLMNLNDIFESRGRIS